MTNDERDFAIKDTHDKVLVMSKMVRDHDTDLYGNGKLGLKIDVAGLKIFRTLSCWFYGVIGIAGIGMIFKLVYSHITG